ncbi:MAG TPA: NTP transferase domain-containing protein [Methanoregulaceae archaeon]|nr:NTP transferase domain-containing protein [Methanoregulaceae archaeon]
MYALILAGGSGTRLNLGEKPLVTLKGRPMIEFVIKAFHDAGHEVVVVLTEKAPYTLNWCRARTIPFLVTSGAGYIEDLAEAAAYLEIRDPFFSCVADLPCISPATICEIREHYQKSGKEACSVWVPEELFRKAGSHPSYSGSIGTIPACPAGINILRGDLMEKPQDELQLLLWDESLAYNINTREELDRVRQLFQDR